MKSGRGSGISSRSQGTCRKSGMRSCANSISTRTSASATCSCCFETWRAKSSSRSTMRRLRRFLALPAADRRLLVEAALFLWAIRLGLRMLPFRTLWRLLDGAPRAFIGLPTDRPFAPDLGRATAARAPGPSGLSSSWRRQGRSRRGPGPRVDGDRRQNRDGRIEVRARALHAAARAECAGAMSAIVGFYGRDGQPVDRADLERMTASLAHRGPDAAGVWNNGPVGLGHRMLWTTPESLHEQLPLTSKSGDLVITADARIDNRDELITALGLAHWAHGEIPDSELILRAYEQWGEDSPKRLLGDFAFAIWDERRQTLFCARDHCGVKPFYYYQSARALLFASEIKAL